jgi:hypothetical protein
MDSNKNTTKDEKYQKTTIEFIHQIINQAENYVSLFFGLKNLKKVQKEENFSSCKIIFVEINFYYSSKMRNKK